MNNTAYPRELFSLERYGGTEHELLFMRYLWHKDSRRDRLRSHTWTCVCGTTCEDNKDCVRHFVNLSKKEQEKHAVLILLRNEALESFQLMEEYPMDDYYVENLI